MFSIEVVARKEHGVGAKNNIFDSDWVIFNLLFKTKVDQMIIIFRAWILNVYLSVEIP